MTPEIIAAIIGAVATVIAAIIAVISNLSKKGKEDKNNNSEIAPNKLHESPKLITATTNSKVLNKEIFSALNEWEFIEKIGKWEIINSSNRNSTIVGSGMYSYLLSRNEYGKRHFRIHSKIRFYNYASHANRGGETGASSFVLGWVNTDSGHQYFNLVFTGHKLILEAIGFNNRPDYLDSYHLHKGVPFSIIEGNTYDFIITISPETLEVYLDGHSLYLISLPAPICGKVGLRPWRARIECDYFEVSEM